MSLQRIYFKQTDGYFRYGRLASESFHYAGGKYDTDNPRILKAAQAAMAAGREITAIQDPPTPKPEPVAAAAPDPEIKTEFLQCGVCGDPVHPSEWEMHKWTHGADVPPPVPMKECHRCHQQVAVSEWRAHLLAHGREAKAAKRILRQAQDAGSQG